MRNAVFFLALLCFLLLTVFLHRELDRAGSPQAVPGDPRRIVSLAPNATEILYALGLGPRVAGVTRFCAYPPEVASKLRVAGFSDINFEALVRLRPDLALLSGGKTADQKQLERLGIPVLTLDTSSLTGFFRSIESIGSATGRFAEAGSIIQGFQQALEAARNRARGRARPRVLFSVMRSGREPGRITEIHAVGRDGFFNELIEAAGGENAYRGEKKWCSIYMQLLIITVTCSKPSDI